MMRKNMAAVIHKRLLPTEIERLKQLRRRNIWKYGRSILTLAIFFGIFVFSCININSYEQGIIYTAFMLSGNIPVPVLEMRPTNGATNLVAVIAYPFSGSKEFMPRLGIELTHAGITSYLFDLPGYGESPVPLTDENLSQPFRQENTTALEEVVNYIRSRHNISQPPSILLVGYSTGATTVSDYLEADHEESDLVSTILLSPTNQDVLVDKTPKNLLILTGQYDLSAPTANKIFQRYCKQTARGNVFTAECGNPAIGTGIREVVLPFLNNSMLPLVESTSQAILAWIHNAYPQVVDKNKMWFDTYIFWLLLGLVGIYLATVPLCSLLIRLFNIHSIPIVFPRWNMFFIYLYLLLSIPISIILYLVWAPFRFVHILSIDDLIGYFFCIAAITIFFMWLTRRILPFPLFRQTFRQFLVGALLSLFLYLTLGQLTLFPWSPFSFTAPGLWRFGIIFILLWPVFMFYEGVTHGFLERRTFLWRLSYYSLQALFLISLLIFLFLIPVPGKELFSTIWPVLVLLFLMLETCCWRLYKQGRAAIAGATVSACMMAWALSTLFPFIR